MSARRPSARTVLWRRLNEPGLEYCTVTYADKGVFFDGHVIVALEDRPLRVEYTVECDVAWATGGLSLRCYFADATTSMLELRRDDTNVWHRVDPAHLTDDVGLPQITGCVDVDLGITPATNTLPICRLGLAVGESADVTAAWVRFPSLAVQPLRQRYTRLDTSRYRYESATGFTAELNVDDLGLVTDYPGGWERVVLEDLEASR